APSWEFRHLYGSGAVDAAGPGGGGPAGRGRAGRQGGGAVELDADQRDQLQRVLRRPGQPGRLERVRVRLVDRLLLVEPGQPVRLPVQPLLRAARLRLPQLQGDRCLRGEQVPDRQRLLRRPQTGVRQLRRRHQGLLRQPGLDLLQRRTGVRQQRPHPGAARRDRVGEPVPDPGRGGARVV
ncbi:MAG: putative secreted protein, partial [uncultured Corynebacteriales bacterium]